MDTSETIDLRKLLPGLTLRSDSEEASLWLHDEVYKLLENPERRAQVWFDRIEKGKVDDKVLADVRREINDIGSFVILGNPGPGKTSLLLRLACDLLNQKLDAIPVIFPLTRWYYDGNKNITIDLLHHVVLDYQEELDKSFSFLQSDSRIHKLWAQPFPSYIKTTEQSSRFLLTLLPTSYENPFRVLKPKVDTLTQDVSTLDGKFLERLEIGRDFSVPSVIVRLICKALRANSTRALPEELGHASRVFAGIELAYQLWFNRHTQARFFYYTDLYHFHRTCITHHSYRSRIGGMFLRRCRNSRRSRRMFLNQGFAVDMFRNGVNPYALPIHCGIHPGAHAAQPPLDSCSWSVRHQRVWHEQRPRGIIWLQHHRICSVSATKFGGGGKNSSSITARWSREPCITCINKSATKRRSRLSAKTGSSAWKLSGLLVCPQISSTHCFTRWDTVIVSASGGCYAPDTARSPAISQ
jgi:hypothetical protein